ncbi:MAG TPA: BMP family ABC transporter substrate-binding protein [Patescibacteria group bacterium]|nr:BMP family ABC transporter substrate-binding protein [Patescibacteria group bacterium]
MIIVLMVATASAYWLTRPKEEEKLEVAVVMWGFHDEGLWDPAAANAVLNLEEKYNLEITWAEEIDFTQLESLLRTLAGKNDVIYLTTDEFEEAMRAVAPSFPDVYWIQQYESTSISSDYFPENVVAFNAYQASDLSFWAGAIAAKITETNKLGVVQAIAGPRDTRLMSAAFRSGAHYVNEEIEVFRVVIGAYVDPIKTRDSVASLVEVGCDMVFVGMDDESGTLEAKEKGIYSIQEYRDIVSEHPDTMIGCTCWVWDVLLDEVFDAIVNDSFDEFRAENYEMSLSLEDRSLDIPTFGNMVSEDVKEFAEDLREKILDGTVEVPLIDEW